MATPKPTVTQIQAGTGDILISWTYPSGRDCVHLETSWGEDRWVYYNTSTTTTIANPVFNQSIYWVRIIAHDSITGVDSGWSDYTIFSLNPTPPKPLATPPTNITISYGSGTSVTVRFTKGSNVSYTVIDKTWLPEGDFNKYIYTTGTSAAFTIPIKGLTYYLKLASVNEDSIYSSWVWSPSIFIKNRPDNFIGNLYKVLNGSDVVDTVQWKNFANKINEFRVYKGYSNYNFSLANNASSGNTFTASHFNEIVDSMNEICTGLYTVSSGMNVYKSYFDNLVNALNNIT